MPKPSKKGSDAPAPPTDSRFASFQTDPRFRLPSKKTIKTQLDSRFEHALTDRDFTNTAKVDRYGRKVKTDKKNKALHSLYERAPELKPEENEEEDDVLEEDVEIDDDEAVQRELRRAHRKVDPARGGGFSESGSDDSSSEEDDDDSESDAEDRSVVATADMEQFKQDQEDVETGEVTSRLAIVNLDWDHLKSVDLMALLGSFAPEDGRINRVSVFPSEFGKERMQNEEINGPPKELFKGDKKRKSKNHDSSDDSDSDSDSDEKIRKNLMKDSEGNDEDMHSDALRKYQLDRLRYYYAVMECSNAATAKKIYDATDGTEYQSSSNLLDLRFVPDDVTFDDPPRDTCTKVPDSYNPIDFVTSALQSSKVKLTWDMHPEEISRKDAQKKAFSGSRADIEENDMNAYLASDTSDSEAEEQDDEAPKLSKREQAKRDLRAALGLADEPAPRSKKENAGDMEVTFLPAFSEKSSKKTEPENETTIEKYKRKEKERKESKRTKAKAQREGQDEENDDEVEDAQDGDDNLGFNDPFFTQAEEPQTSKSALRKEERLKKRAAKEAADLESVEQKALLTKLMAPTSTSELDGAENHPGHYDMKSIKDAEKAKTKKGKAAKRMQKRVEKADGALQDDFEMAVGDERFGDMFRSHEFAVDPSHPSYTGTEGGKRIVEEGRKRSGEDMEGKRKKKGKR